MTMMMMMVLWREGEKWGGCCVEHNLLFCCGLAIIFLRMWFAFCWACPTATTKSHRRHRRWSIMRMAGWEWVVRWWRLVGWCGVCWIIYIISKLKANCVGPGNTTVVWVGVCEKSLMNFIVYYYHPHYITGQTARERRYIVVCMEVSTHENGTILRIHVCSPLGGRRGHGTDGWIEREVLRSVLCQPPLIPRYREWYWPNNCLFMGVWRFLSSRPDGDQPFGLCQFVYQKHLPNDTGWWVMFGQLYWLSEFDRRILGNCACCDESLSFGQYRKITSFQLSLPEKYSIQFRMKQTNTAAGWW